MKAMVLCAGFGTRLRPLTDTVPKPLVPLCGLPLLQFNFALLRSVGVSEIVINTHHLAPAMEKGAREIAAKLGVTLHVLEEKGHILGTGGGVRNAASLLAGSTFFLLNGDMLFDVDLDAALQSHRAAKAVATMVLAPYPKGANYGAVEVDAQSNVRRIVGRGAAGELNLTKCHFTGVHVLEPEVLSRLPAEGASDINRTAYIRLIHEGAPVHGFMQKATWADLGAPPQLLRSNLDVLSGAVPMTRFKPGADPWQDTVERAPGVFVHQRANVSEGAELHAPLLILEGAQVASGARLGPGVVVGKNARIDAGASAEQALVWDHAHLGAGERLHRVIAAPGVRLEA